MELLSTVVRLRSRQSVSKCPFAGRHAQAWFLREIGRHDPVLVEQLHDASNEDDKQKMRPYTLSGLYKGPHTVWELSKDDWCWIRITALTKELSDFLYGKVLPELLPVARIGQVEFDVQAWKPET